MAKGKKAPTGANGFVSIKISAAAYSAAEAQCEKLSAEVSKQAGMTVTVRPSQVIEKLLLGK